MYLKKVQIENVGPFKRALRIALPFSETRTPKPVILVGKNGAGKTTLLANIVDSLHEFCAQHYSDSLPKEGAGYAYFKVSGSTNQHVGSEFGLSLLEFEHATQKFLYLDKTGKLTKQECERLWEEPVALDGWKDTENTKLTTQSTAFKEIFWGDVFAFFPAHRNETPNWLNSENPTIRGQFSIKRRFSGTLAKPIVVSESADSNRGWLLDVVLDHQLYQDGALLDAANNLLSGVLGRDDIRFGVGPRMGQTRVAICENSGGIVMPSTSHLSGGAGCTP